MWFIIEKEEVPNIFECYMAESARLGLRPCYDASPSTYRLDWNVGPNLAFIRRHLSNFRRHSHLYTGYRKPDGSVRWIKSIQTPRRRRNAAFLESLLPRVIVAGNRSANQGIVQRRMAAFTSPAMFRLVLLWVRFELTGGQKEMLSKLLFEGLVVPSAGRWYVMDYVL